MVDLVPLQVALLVGLAIVSTPILSILVPPFCLVVVLGIVLWGVQDLFSKPHKIALPTKSVTEWKDFESNGQIIKRTHSARDGVKLVYYVVPAKKPSTGKSKIALICQPLGNCGLLHWYSSMVTLGEEWTFITWDYRGFFNSDRPRRLRNVSVRDHAMDGLEVFRAALRGGPDCEPLPGYEHIAHDDTAINTMAADLVLGHSMGVQVALEFCLLYPDCCNSLALFNGTSGHALHSGLQPTLQLPYLGDILSSLLSLVLQDTIVGWYGWLLDSMRAFFLKPMIATAIRIYVSIFGSRTLRQILGPNYMVEFAKSYLGGICMDHKSLSNFLRGFQELDAHSCTHLLWQVHCPVLLVAGLWDVLTPCYCMARISKLVQGPCRLVVDMYSTHATLLEHPERALGELQHFAEVVLPCSQRKDSTRFEQLADNTKLD